MNSTNDVQETVEKAMAAAARSWTLPVRAAYTSGHLRAVRARAAAMVWSHQQGFTLQAVAGAMDMDHSTLSHHKKEHPKRLAEQGQYSGNWSTMTALLAK